MSTGRGRYGIYTVVRAGCPKEEVFQRIPLGLIPCFLGRFGCFHGRECLLKRKKEKKKKQLHCSRILVCSVISLELSVLPVYSFSLLFWDCSRYPPAGMICLPVPPPASLLEELLPVCLCSQLSKALMLWIYLSSILAKFIQQISVSAPSRSCCMY